MQRSDENSMIAHQELVAKAKQGGIDLYFLGDSITRRWGCADETYRELLDHWNANFYGWNAGNFGWGGDTTENILWRIQNGELDRVDPKIIVLLAGTNNLGGDVDVVLGIEAILAECQLRAPHAVIILTAIFPRNDTTAFLPLIEEVNRRLERLCDGKWVRFLNVNDKLADSAGVLFPEVTVDGLHLSVDGYQIWADGLRPLLLGLLGPQSVTDTAPPPTSDPSTRRS